MAQSGSSQPISQKPRSTQASAATRRCTRSLSLIAGVSRGQRIAARRDTRLPVGWEAASIRDRRERRSRSRFCFGHISAVQTGRDHGQSVHQGQ